MTEPLPKFRYHPDPIATGMVKPSEAVCVCCNRTRGYIYVGSVYSRQDLDGSLCPWCIYDGSAASKLGASFVDSHSLAEVGVAKDIIEEVSLRTPGYVSWQGESWLSHCDDACEFHGDASIEDVQNASEKTKLDWQAAYGLTEVEWNRIVDHYQPGGHDALYKFVCRHCELVMFGWDCS